jgi:hypothetical protein
LSRSIPTPANPRVGRSIEWVIGDGPAFCLDGNADWKYPNHFFESLRDRVVDFPLLEHKEGSRRMKTLRPDFLLLLQDAESGIQRKSFMISISIIQEPSRSCRRQCN